MELIPQDSLPQQNFYFIPHHGVFKKGSNKIRVVFNASQKSSKGHSLNSYLRVGPNLQEEVLTVILRWRFYAYALTCNIVKMYRQFLIHQDDKNWQLILWRNLITGLLEFFRLLKVTYGEGCAPFQANAAIIELAKLNKAKFPRGAKAIRERRYMDDFNLGEDDLEELIRSRDELIQISHTAGLELGK